MSDEPESVLVIVDEAVVVEELTAARDEAREVAWSLLVLAERALALAVTIQSSRAEAEGMTRNSHGVQSARLKIEAWDTEA